MPHTQLKNTPDEQIRSLCRLVEKKQKSPSFWISYIMLKTKSGLPIHDSLSKEEREALDKVAFRIRNKEIQQKPSQFDSMRIFLDCLKRNRKSLEIVKMSKPNATWVSLYDDFMDTNYRWTDGSEFHRQDRDTKLRILGRFLRTEAAHIIAIKHQELCEKLDGNKLFHNRLPMYACSGELEFSSINSIKLSRLSKVRNKFWDIGHDGGGQHEVRFLIHEKLPDYACSLVNRLGGTARNGGHIHLNCRKDEQVAIRVYNALRYHLSWFRFLEPKARRESRFCRVGYTSQRFKDSKGNKYSAVTASSFEHYGTVEVRLWGTTADPDLWHSRARFMQAIAKWSESNESLDETNQAHPIKVDVGIVGFRRIAEWLHANDMQTLKWVVTSLRKRSRQRSRDPHAASVSADLFNTFLNMNLKIPGVRLPKPTTPMPVITNN